MDNLKAEMQRNGLTVKDIMSTIGCSVKKPRRGAGGNGEIMKYEEIMAAIKDINGPWSNAACRGYCRMAMKSAGVDEKTQNDVLRELHFCMDTVSVEEAAREG